MKKIIITLTFIFSLYNVSFAQTSKSEPEMNCYLKWAEKFEERGAEEVLDGVYPDVIITFRNGSEAECYNGKCEVKDGKIMGMYLKMEDGSFEKVKKKIRYDFPVTITNGMSKTVLTFEDELINVLFVKLVKAKKAGFMKAAEPTDD